jgi:hypothetical protein
MTRRDETTWVELLDDLDTAADAWQAAPIGSVEESDAAGEMYRAARAIKTHLAGQQREAA